MKGFCVNCEYCVKKESSVYFCDHPRYADPVTGEAITPCRKIRSMPSFLINCGHNGSFFKEKQTEVFTND